MSENPQPAHTERRPLPKPVQPARPLPASTPTTTAAAEPRTSTTAMDTHEQDLLGMGRTAGQRTAEVFAGLRAEMLRTSEAIALSRIGGRITARLLISVGSKKALNFVPVRYGTFAGLIKQALGANTTGKVWVEVAAGFSPRGIMLAREMPDLKVIEIDIPDVVEEKRKRLEKGGISVPRNISWLSADLGVEPLGDVLDHQSVDVVSAEGLMPYFEHADITRIAQQVRQSLKPDGTFIADLGYTSPEGASEASSLVRIFRRYTSSAPGVVYDEETAYQLFRDAGYGQIDLYRMPQMAERFGLPTPGVGRQLLHGGEADGGITLSRVIWEANHSVRLF